MRLPILFAITAALSFAGETRNVILVTADGLRWQEVLGGMDPLFKDAKAAHMDKAADLRKQLWRDSAAERRELLMPFLWKTLVPQGLLLGDAEVTNAYRVSYPGYSEILTGRAQDEAIRGNDEIQNPTETVLEYVRRRLNLKASQVALFGSWSTFHFIGEHTPGAITINAGYRAAHGSKRMEELSALQFDILTGWESVRHDWITFEMALEHLRTQKPRVMHIAFGETDDWAHEKRYDRYLDTIRLFDRSVERLWSELQRDPAYRGKTSLILAVDHGRGAKVDDWSGHGRRVEGAERIWIGVLGPDTPATGEAKGVKAYQRDIAPTIVQWLGLDPKEYEGVKGTPIRAAFR